jgi:uncharacterized circularly permuted ATP-grasp superfamily protein
MARDHVLANMDSLVVKAANESGGYGLLIGPTPAPPSGPPSPRPCAATRATTWRSPMLTLSTVPTVIGNRVAPRHVDLRPFILSGARTDVTAGGLTRVALVEGSTVVNSSQGGGSKDTWIIDVEGGTG